MLMVAYMGGGGCQKWQKKCLRNLRMAPISSTVEMIMLSYPGCNYSWVAA